MKLEMQRNSLYFKILLTVVIGIICVALIVGYTSVNISRRVLIESYSDGQEKIFERVYEDLYKFHSGIVNIINTVNDNRNFKTYFTTAGLPQQEEFATIYGIQTLIKSLMPSISNDLSILIVGLNEQTYFNKEELLTMTGDKILDLNISKNALEDPKIIQYQYLEKGLTSSTKSEPSLIITKALTLNSGVPYGVIYFIMKEKDFEKIYDYFTLEIQDAFLFNQDNVIISSNKKEYVGNVGGELQEKTLKLLGDDINSKSFNDKKSTVLVRKLSYCNLILSGIIDNTKAIDKMYDINNIIEICIFITGCILISIFILVKQFTKPLYILTKKMSNVRSGNFNEFVEVSGPQEIIDLSSTFNYMLKDLNKYINEIVKIQKEKRESEIQALQMQINPHYIYNTLSSIKFLIWQEENNKAIEAIDSFIILLRNTISNTDEFITVSEEISNLKKYVFINNIRYGDNVMVEYFITPSCEEYLLPKLILQPFIENAFFHAFPSNKKGEIYVFISELGENIRVEICDNGVGIEEDELETIKGNSKRAERHFSGIGINNVDNRVKLIYGNEYGVQIKSVLNKGTTVTILLPIKAKKD